MYLTISYNLIAVTFTFFFEIPRFVFATFPIRKKTKEKKEIKICVNGRNKFRVTYLEKRINETIERHKVSQTAIETEGRTELCLSCAHRQNILNNRSTSSFLSTS